MQGRFLFDTENDTGFATDTDLGGGEGTEGEKGGYGCGSLADGMKSGGDGRLYG